MVQQFIDGDEFSVDCYVDKNGNIISVVPRKRLEVINGEATRSITIKDNAVINLCLQILSKGLFNGPVTIQFIKEKTTGVLYLIEINPRLGSGVLTSVHAGANICEYIIKDFLNIALEPNKDWKEGVIMTRAFQEFYFYATDN
jgi:carbamoyl-phosphate synthase large subunit